ncbi:MAG: hypothetical protein QOE84_1460 [Actinomycetota bacterium]|nr:hypothetical protein [Actinomycetota bacterium]
MRIPGAALAITAVLVTACGSSSGPSPRAAATPSSTLSASPSVAASPPPGALTSARLKAALIGVSDLPKGFSEDTVPLGTTLLTSATDTACATAFQTVNSVLKSGPVAVFAEARASFSKGKTGPFLRDSIRSYPTRAAAVRFLADVHSVFTKCPTFQVTNPTTQRVTAVRLSPLAFPRVGNEGVAVVAELATRGGSVLRSLLVFARQGQSIAYVVEIANGASDAVLLEKAVRAQVAKLTKA